MARAVGSSEAAPRRAERTLSAPPCWGPGSCCPRSAGRRHRRGPGRDSRATESARQGCLLRPVGTLADARDALGLWESLLSSDNYEALELALLRLWSRGYRGTHSVVLKATSSASRIGTSLLDRLSGARAVYLNLGAEPYLATLLAGKNSAFDLRGHGPVRIRKLKTRTQAPLAPLLVVRAACAFPVNSTAASATTPPVWSVMVPRMLPVVSGRTTVGSPPPHPARMTTAEMNSAASLMALIMRPFA